MSEHKKIFLTGATGFLGSHLAWRLLLEGHHISVLARGSKTLSARDRVVQTLRDVGATNFRNLDVFEGDISLPNLGLSEAVIQNIIASTDEVWHCAASLSFQQEDRGAIFRMNVGGTQHVLALTERTRRRRLQHVSTAYIAGNRSDVVLESEIDVGQSFKNAYEESKCQAELLIADAHRRGTVSGSVYRPSIVIGDSKSGRVTHFHGVYAFIRALWASLERLRRRMPGGGLITLPLSFLTGAVASLLWPDAEAASRFTEVERRALLGVAGE